MDRIQIIVCSSAKEKSYLYSLVLKVFEINAFHEVEILEFENISGNKHYEGKWMDPLSCLWPVA